MKPKDIFLTASANMMRSKLRTFLTILAIFIGAFTLTLTNGLGAGISNYVDRQVANLGQKDLIVISAKTTSSTSLSSSDEPQKYNPDRVTATASVIPGSGVSTAVLTEKDITKLKSYNGIANVQASVSASPDYIEGANGDKYQLQLSSMGMSTSLDLAAGRQIATEASGNEIVLPVSYVSVLGYGSASEAVGKDVTIGISDATGAQHIVTANIVGIQQKGLVGSSSAVINHSLKSALYDEQSFGLPAASKDKYAMATAKITGDLSDSHIQQVKDKLAEMGYNSQTISDTLGTFKTVINAITYVLNGFAVIALVAASFGIVNTLFMSVQERTKEIGLMKAMGMRSSRIFLLFSLEAVLIGFWGSVIGVVSAMGIGTLANSIASNSILKDLPGFNLLAFPPLTITLIVLLIMAIAFLAGTLPARRAAKQNPIDALRYE